MAAPGRFFFAIALWAAPALAHCGPDTTTRIADGADGGPGGVPDGPGGDGGEGEACDSAGTVEALRACIGGGGAPRDCLAQRRGDDPAPCDGDGDGLDDALEDALLRSYAPVFAFNQGTGSRTHGDSEPNFPINVEHFITHASLVWRVDGNATTREPIDPSPTLQSIADATHTVGGRTYAASSPALGHGPNFWLCLNRADGRYAEEALVPSMDASRRLDGGIDVVGVVHPTSPKGDGRYAAVQFMLLYAYNAFSFANHEGDWEGGAVFVDLETGKVPAVFTDRHDTADGAKLSALEGEGAVAVDARDPSADAPLYNVCSNGNETSAGGVRFWDFAGPRHHPVFYVSAGSHAMFSYPGATKITGVACLEPSIVRDVHNGNGPKFAPDEGAYYADWRGAAEAEAKSPVERGVHFVNLGERDRPRARWSTFAGQWGCDLELIPKSYPGPWDNERLCRGWLSHDWGAAPPFAPPPKASCRASDTPAAPDGGP